MGGRYLSGQEFDERHSGGRRCGQLGHEFFFRVFRIAELADEAPAEALPMSGPVAEFVGAGGAGAEDR